MMHARRESVLTLRGYGVGHGCRFTLESANLELPSQGITVLLGPSGTGKSTLLRALSGEGQCNPSLSTVGESRYCLEGAFPVLVAQNIRLLASSIFENLVKDWPGRSTRTIAQQRAYLDDWLASLGQESLGRNLHLPVAELPLHKQRLVAILRAALLGTPLILLDEPTAGLSAAQSEPILALLRQIGKRQAMLVAMHHLAQSRSLADQILLIASRKIQEFSPAESFFTEPHSEAGRLFLSTGSCPEEPYPTVQKERQ